MASAVPLSCSRTSREAVIVLARRIQTAWQGCYHEWSEFAHKSKVNNWLLGR